MADGGCGSHPQRGKRLCLAKMTVGLDGALSRRPVWMKTPASDTGDARQAGGLGRRMARTAGSGRQPGLTAGGSGSTCVMCVRAADLNPSAHRSRRCTNSGEMKRRLGHILWRRRENASCLTNGFADGEMIVGCLAEQVNGVSVRKCHGQGQKHYGTMRKE